MIHLNAAEDGVEELVLQPMDNWRLHNEFKNGKAGWWPHPIRLVIRYHWCVCIVAGLYQFNESLYARSEKRAKEVGIRKTVGSVRPQLIKQFLTESIVVAFPGLVIALALCLGIDSFFQWAYQTKKFIFPEPIYIFGFLYWHFTLFTGIISGSYPAFYLSGFEPIKVLKGTFRVGRFAALPRKVLVVVQFSISIALIIGTIIVYRQIQYAKDRPVGYTREGLITIYMNTPDLDGSL